MNDVQFRRQVDEALKKVARVLDNTRTPVYPADCQHTYDDKYGLAEFLGNVTVASLLNVLELLGVTDEHFARLYEWAQQRTITLGFSAEQSCTFVRKAKRREQSPTELVTTTTFLGISTKSTSKSTYTIKERFWSFKASWQLFAYRGTAADERIVLAAHQGAAELVTSGTKHAPQSSGSVAYHEVDVSWLFRQSSDQRVMRFAIDRSLPSCHTPRRNNAVAAALSATDALVLWTGNVRRYFESHLFPIQPQGKSSYPLAQIEPSTLFVPVVPLLDDSLLDPAPSSSSAAASSSSSSSSSVAFTLTSNGGVVLSLADANQFLNEQRRSIVEKFAELDKSFPQDGELIQAAETHVVLLCKQAERVCQAFRSGVDVIEAMLYNQLVAAIGKEVTPVDFAAYMRFHNRKLFHKQFEPRPFCYAVRRPEHFPEGTLSIESTGDDGPQPITTIVRQIEPARPMNFAIDASTRVTFNGQRYLHAWMGHTFQGHSPAELTLVARARQFSSFVLMIGRVASATVFEPVAAVIVQNKDELRVALNLEQIPAPRDFAEAIRSLSPEQQAFCKAYRQMQLESTLFGLLVVQIKPQLEKLLRIPDDALTKEIRLTQDLLELFIKYQIPSDLLTYDGADAASLRTKIDAVRGYVANMNQMIAARRSAELSSTVQTAVYRALADEPSIRAGANFSPAERRVLTAGRGRTTATSGQSATSDGAYADDDDDDDPSLFDFTAVPHLLDARMARIDVDGALSPTIISASPGAWTRRSQASLMSDPVTSTLGDQDKAVEKSKAFDLLDALSRSGALEVDHCELHVVIAAMHRFDHSLMQTVVEDNINPIDKVERSTLLIAELVHDTDVASLIKADHLQRVQATSPVLFQQ